MTSEERAVAKRLRAKMAKISRRCPSCSTSLTYSFPDAVSNLIRKSLLGMSDPDASWHYELVPGGPPKCRPCGAALRVVIEGEHSQELVEVLREMEPIWYGLPVEDAEQQALAVLLVGGAFIEDLFDDE